MICNKKTINNGGREMKEPITIESIKKEENLHHYFLNVYPNG